MKLLSLEIFADKWDHTAHLLDIRGWMWGYERTQKGDHELWAGPFYLSWYLHDKTKRDRKGPQIGVPLNGRAGPPSETV